MKSTSRPEPDRREWRKWVLLGALVVACLVPFLGKAVHVDDPLFLWSAEQIREDPLDFYGFEVNWYGWDMAMHRTTKNPPLASYYIAAVSLVAGWSESALHFAFLLPALGLILGTYALAHRFCPQPLLAGCATLASPVFLVSASGLMSDTLMLCFWVWAVHFWLEGLERESRLRLTLAATLIALAALTKYFGMSLLPLLAVYAGMRTRRAGFWLGSLAIPVAIMAGYQAWTKATYGTGLLSDAASYALDFGAARGAPWLLDAGVCLSFAGGCFLPVLFYAPLLWRRRVLFIGLGLAGVIGLAFALADPITLARSHKSGSQNWGLVAQLALFAGAGLGMLWLAITDLRRRRDADSLLLVLWLVGTFVFAGFINWSINGRSLLPLAPAAGILLARHIGNRPWKSWIWPLVPALAIALSVTWSDHVLAGAQREAASRIAATYAPERLWFQGHWGFQYYMERAGARPLPFQQPRLEVGDIVVVPTNNTNLRPLHEDTTRLLQIMKLPVLSWVSSFNLKLGAGFYSDRFGPAPYVFGPTRTERYMIYEVLFPIGP